MTQPSEITRQSTEPMSTERNLNEDDRVLLSPVAVTNFERKAGKWTEHKRIQIPEEFKRK